jgi:hypothetical protein
MKKPPQLPTIPTLELNGFNLDVQYYLQKEYNDISEAAVELPTVIEYLNYQHQIALEMKLRKKAEQERTEASVYFELKGGGFQDKGYGDKITADALKAAVCLDERVIELNEDIAIWSALEDRLDRLARSLTSKLEIVRSSEATRRKLVEG